MIDWLQLNLVGLVNVIIIDVVLAGDNAIIVGLAASRVAPENRARVIFWGMAGAVALRIAFAAVTVQLLAIVGLTLAGGILLLWVCWKMYRQIKMEDHHDPANESQDPTIAAARHRRGGRHHSRGVLRLVAARVAGERHRYRIA